MQSGRLTLAAFASIAGFCGYRLGRARPKGTFHVDATERHNPRRSLMPTLASGFVRLAYQPKLALNTGQISSVEALLRWDDPADGYLPPSSIIKRAEASGELDELTLWIASRALTERAVLAAAGHPLTMFINVPANLLIEKSFIHRLCVMVRAAEGGALGLEITESAIIDNPELAIVNLRSVAALGVALAIDDYGSGLSSLAYLKDLPASELKIDRQFVSGMTTSHRDPLIVRSTIELAHALGMTIVAEGVENVATLALLRVMGCDYAQGFAVSPPLSVQQLLSYLSEGDHLLKLKSMSGSVRPPDAFWTREMRDPSIRPQNNQSKT